MTAVPRLAVHVGRQVPAALAEVLTATTAWWQPAAAAAAEPVPDGVLAHLYTSEVLPRRPERPSVVWRLAAADAVEGADVVLCEAGTVDAAPHDLQVCLLPWPDGARLLLPFTRARYRELRGLPARLVAEATDGELRWGSTDEVPRRAPDVAWPTLAALSSVVVACGTDRLWSALAWAAPAVTDPGTARRLGLSTDDGVLVGADPDERRALAAALAADETRASALGRRGWTVAGSRRAGSVAEELARRLGVPRRRPATAGPRLIAALDALGTPRDSLVRRRAREATAALPGAVTQGWRPIERNDHAQP